MTLHRPSNLNDDILKDIFEAISNFTDDYQVILPAIQGLKITLKIIILSFQMLF